MARGGRNTVIQIAAKTVFTYLMALAGSMGAKKLHIPMGEILGSVFVVILLKLFTPLAAFPSSCKMLVQFCLGAVVASRISRQDVAGIKKMAVPFLLIITGLAVYTLLCASLIHANTDFDIPTALLCSAPGGMSDMAIIAQDFGASSDYVSAVHVLRSLTIFAFSPLLYRSVLRFGKSKYAPRFISDAVAGYGVERERADHAARPLEGNKAAAALRTLAAAATGGWLFKSLGVPAGAMIGAIIATIVLNLTAGGAFVPPALKRYARIGVGCYIGIRLEREFLLHLDALIFPVLTVLCGITLFTVIMAFVISHVFKYDLITSMLMCIPGGITEVSVIAEEFGVDQTKIMSVHSLRLICVVGLFPNLIYLLEYLFGL